MEREIKERFRLLVQGRRVMTLSVVAEEQVWSAPVYFVWQAGRFHFFSHPESSHVPASGGTLSAAATIYHDADEMADIFGIQMAGIIKETQNTGERLKIIGRYVKKFSFLQKQFGQKIVDDPSFIMTRFKSRCYYFEPEKVVLSDITSSKSRQEICVADLSEWMK